jgi:hypothetical protein
MKFVAQLPKLTTWPCWNHAKAKLTVPGLY